MAAPASTYGQPEVEVNRTVKRILRDVERRWLSLKPWQREALAAFLVCTGCAAVGYWYGYRDGSGD